MKCFKVAGSNFTAQKLLCWEFWMMYLGQLILMVEGYIVLFDLSAAVDTIDPDISRECIQEFGVGLCCGVIGILPDTPSPVAPFTNMV